MLKGLVSRLRLHRCALHSAGPESFTALPFWGCGNRGQTHVPARAQAHPSIDRRRIQRRVLGRNTTQYAGVVDLFLPHNRGEQILLHCVAMTRRFGR